GKLGRTLWSTHRQRVILVGGAANDYLRRRLNPGRYHRNGYYRDRKPRRPTRPTNRRPRGGRPLANSHGQRRSGSRRIHYCLATGVRPVVSTRDPRGARFLTSATTADPGPQGGR